MVNEILIKLTIFTDIQIPTELLSPSRLQKRFLFYLRIPVNSTKIKNMEKPENPFQSVFI